MGKLLMHLNICGIKSSLNLVIDCFTGKAFNDGIEFVFEHRQIEDLWIPYFCITTDISDSSMKAHTHGKVPAATSLISYGKQFWYKVCHLDKKTQN